MIPVTTIGGYLGAGKTTLVNHLLRHANGLRLAVLVNEFGELPIDEDLIEAQDDDIISIAGGCICCSFGDNLVGALMELSASSPPPDHILIEASGVAIPASIAASISLLTGFVLNGIVVLADAETIRKAAQDRYLGDTILRQLQDADLVIVTKTDLIGETEYQAVKTWLNPIAKSAKIIPVQHGRVPQEVILGPEIIRSPASSLSRAASEPHADAMFDSLVFDLDHPVHARDLAENLANGAFGIIRAKGFVEDVSGGTTLVQVVGSRFETSAVETRPHHGVVCIGRAGDLHKSGLATLFGSMTLVP